jgi:hypothetical protein
MDVDPAGRHLFILDSGTSQVVSVNLNDEFALDSKIDLAHLGAPNLRGIAVHPVSHHLFVMNPHEEILYELTQSGQLVNRYILTDLELIDPRGLAFAPSADLTDAPETIHLYIADSNLPDAEPASSAKMPWMHKVYRPESAQACGNAPLESHIRPAPAKTEQLFGRILEVELDPGAGASD